MARRKLKYFIYDLVLYCLTVCYLPWLSLRRFLKHRPVFAYFKRLTPEQLKIIGGRPVIWVQAVSVGEVIVAHCILKELRLLLPEYAIVFTTTTPTGQTMASKMFGDEVVLGYFPYDLPFLVKRFIAQIRPKLFLMVEAEIWPNVIRYCHQAGVKVALVNGLISDRSFQQYSKLKGFLGEVLEQVDLFAMQSVEDANRVGKIGAPLERINVTGNAKLDQVYPEIAPETRKKFLSQYGWRETTRILTAASTHKGEEEIIINAFLRLNSENPSRLILAPRHPERAEEVAALLSNAGISYIRRSTGLSGDDPQAVLVDTFGELGLAYSVATTVFVGGSLIGIGGHNVLEAAAQCKPVIYGPFMHKTKESKRLLEEVDAGFTVQNDSELVETIHKLLSDPELYQKRARAARQAVLANQGAAAATARMTAALLEETEP